MSAFLIGCRFKRPNSPVELPNGDGTFTSYYFRPIDPGNADSEHVALVTNADHATRLLQIPEGYYLSPNADRLKEAAQNAAAIAAAIAKPAAAAPTASTEPVPPGNADETAPPPAGDNGEPAGNPSEPEGQTEKAQGEVSDADRAAAEALLDLSLSKIKEQIPNTPKSVIKAAVELESAKGADERVTVVRALNAAL